MATIKFDEIVKALQAATSPEQISFVARKGSIKKIEGNKGTAVALPHVDARFVQSRLDEACSPLGWQSAAKEVSGVLLVGIGIRNPDTGEWVWKWDTGQQTAEHDNSGFGGKKGIISQGFKRAGAQWGIGRDLYDYPVRRLPCTLNSKGHFYGWTTDPRKARPDFDDPVEPTKTDEEDIKEAVPTPAQARKMVFDYAVDVIEMSTKEANKWINLQEQECEEKTIDCYRDMYQLLVEKKKASEPPPTGELLAEGIVHSEDKTDAPT